VSRGPFPDGRSVPQLDSQMGNFSQIVPRWENYPQIGSQMTKIFADWFPDGPPDGEISPDGKNFHNSKILFWNKMHSVRSIFSHTVFFFSQMSLIFKQIMTL